MPVRMKDVARDLNVSVVTVSKAVRDQTDISPATKKRILKRARDLNYQPNWIARSLVSGFGRPGPIGKLCDCAQPLPRPNLKLGKWKRKAS